MARQYMAAQIERLDREGKGEYRIEGCNLLGYHRSLGPVITVGARSVETSLIIEIDYPWIPFLFHPLHRI